MERIEPKAAGFSGDRLAPLGARLQQYVDQGKFAGFLAMLARPNGVLYQECFGMMDIEAAKPMQWDTIFRIYSMTKPITSVALMMLYEQGKFHLDDPVSKFVPEFSDIKVYAGPAKLGMAADDSQGDTGSYPAAELEGEITIRHLLTHTAGFTYSFFHDSPVDAMYSEAELDRADRSLQELVCRLAGLPLAFQPGTAWRYSMATDVVGYLVELLSEKPLNAFFRERIFEPLNMRDTDFYVPEEKLDRFAAMYGPGETGGLELLDSPATSQFGRPRRLLSGGIGLVSTASDYMRFALMLLNGGELAGSRLLGPKTVELMRANQLPQALIPIQVQPHILHGYGFGLGFQVLVDVVQAARPGSEGEFGWGGAAETCFFIDPKEELAGILMSQLRPSRYYPIRHEFKVLAYQALQD